MFPNVGLPIRQVSSRARELEMAEVAEQYLSQKLRPFPARISGSRREKILAHLLTGKKISRFDPLAQSIDISFIIIMAHVKRSSSLNFEHSLSKFSPSKQALHKRDHRNMTSTNC